MGALARWFSCVRVLWLTPSHRRMLPDSVTRLLFLETASSHPASLSKKSGRCCASSSQPETKSPVLRSSPQA